VDLFVDEKILMQPLRWKSPKRIFVCSQTDLFGEFYTDEMIDWVFAVMALCQQHTFQCLTKRPERMRKYMAALTPDHLDVTIAEMDIQSRREFQWPLPNVWLGVSVEDQATADERIPLLLQTPATKRFVSYEPALAAVNFNPYIGFQTFRCKCGWHETERDLSPEGADRRCLRCMKLAEVFPPVNWIIVGGESGPGARPFDIAWARQTVEQCKAAQVAVFVKQLGKYPVDGLRVDAVGVHPTVEGAPSSSRAWARGDYGARIKLKSRKGADMSEWPEELRVRETPQ
jgi:protein gp37